MAIIFDIAIANMMIDYIPAVCSNASGGSSTIHTLTAFLTTLTFTGVAMLMY